MRKFLFAAAVLIAAGCSGEQAKEDAAAEPPAGTIGTVTISANCKTAWDGAPAEGNALTGKVVEAIGTVIQRAGGIDRIRQLPRVGVEAPPTATFTCTGAVLDRLYRSGVPEILVRPAADATPFLLHLPPPPGMSPAMPALGVITIAADGKMAWNGESVDEPALNAKLAAAAADYAMPTDIAIRTADGTNFEAIYKVVALANRAKTPPSIEWINVPIARTGFRPSREDALPGSPPMIGRTPPQR